MQTARVNLLDRNIVGLIKDANFGKLETDPVKIRFLRFLRALDRAPEHVSPLLSIIEGEKGRQDTPDEKLAVQQKESAALRTFFKHAVTDSGYLDHHSELTSKTFTHYREGGWEARSVFLERAAPLIAQKVKKDRRRRTEGALTAEAKAVGLSPDDPIVMLCIACLYGSDEARGVIKPHELSTYNALNDLHTLSRIHLMRGIAKRLGYPVRFRFITRDANLHKVLNWIRVADSKVSARGNVSMSLRYSSRLFPSLSMAEYRGLIERVVVPPPPQLGHLFRPYSFRFTMRLNPGAFGGNMGLFSA